MTIALPNGIVLTQVKRSVKREAIDLYFTVDGAKLKGDNNRIKLHLYYNIGGPNFATSGRNPRGFYASVVPVQLDGQWEITAAFSGYKNLLREVNRFSAKTLASLEDEAVAFLKLVMETHTDNYFAAESNAA